MGLSFLIGHMGIEGLIKEIGATVTSYVSGSINICASYHCPGSSNKKLFKEQNLMIFSLFVEGNSLSCLWLFEVQIQVPEACERISPFNDFKFVIINRVCSA